MMRLTPTKFFPFLAVVFFFLPASSLTAQRKPSGSPVPARIQSAAAPERKYPALLWEITGNGLQKPSYLFGTMHVSSKMVFHLSDSFYLDIRSADVVALELDPQLWQDQMYRFEHLQSNLRFYTQGAPGDLINEKSFQLERYDDRLKSALSNEPTVINGLLYRTYRARADFEEDTYLDLYIYQTGKKLGKQATGVENFFETERLIMEAAQDMMKDKKKKAPNVDGETSFDLERKLQEAYRKGDLDLLDSLEKLMEPSEAYMEKFLYQRNEIQAGSIDSIVQKHSLFVGVGAAHLPGKRGVIEILRRKGYTLRPVIMPDRDALRRDDIDKIKVPVSFSAFTSDDGDFSVQVPGKLYRRPDNRSDEFWQYADMSNGAYYMIGRVKTHSNFLGQKDETILKKVDSLLYENIPGKILKKTAITRNGYKGFDITGRTRRGDIQRYNILITPYEVWVFKISGTNGYVDGPEADQFFNSIRLRPGAPAAWTDFTPIRGGFTVRWPRQPEENKNTSTADGITRWEYEAADSATGDGFLLWKKTVQNYRFLEEDTADLALMEESFRLSDWIDKPLSRSMGVFNGYPCLDALYLEKDGAYIRVRYLIRGADYYLLAAHTRSKDKPLSNFFGSFAFTPYRYPSYRNYIDTFIRISVATPMVPDVDAGIRGIIERGTSEEFLNSIPDYNNYWPRPKTALFQDDSTGEAVFISVESFPKYYFPKDTISFWQEETSEKRLRRDLIITGKQPIYAGDSIPGAGDAATRDPLFRPSAASITGYNYLLSDTNTLRRIRMSVFLKDNLLFRIVSLGDSLQPGSDFIHRFYSTFRPLGGKPGPSVFASKLDGFFRDFYSKDSLVAKRAKGAIPNIYFGTAGVPALLTTINTLPYNGKDYFETKTKFITELGYINDSVAVTPVVSGLKTIYERVGDTSTFQNAVLKALAHHKTSAAYTLLKQLIVQDPPVFDNTSDYTYLFQDIGDSLALARTLFPELLQLATVDDYKANIQSLLANLVDSGYLHAADYESYFSQVYFDAKIQWKKQEGKDEKRLQKKDDDKDDDSSDGDNDDNASNDLDDYAVLLEPFYDKNPTIPHFFDRLLRSKDAGLRLNTAVLLLRHNRPVADSIIQALAGADASRSRLLRNLVGIHKESRFPKAGKTQESIARSLLVASRGNSDFADIQLVDKRTAQFKQRKGLVYYFKYKVNRDDEWQMGLSAFQPLNTKEVSTDPEFVALTGKRLRQDKPALEQFDQQWKRLLFSRRRSATTFFMDNDYYASRPDED
jgi:uncharacterized protein YbaP (TraB family)